MVAYSAIKEGDILWDCRKTRQGNTTMRSMSCWQVKIISLDPARRTAVVSWNTNAPRLYSERALKALRRTRADKERP